MKVAVKIGYWALVLYDVYLFGMLLTDPTMVHLKRYNGISPILRQCHPPSSYSEKSVIAGSSPTLFPVFAPSTETFGTTATFMDAYRDDNQQQSQQTFCANSNFSFLGDAGLITSNKASCFHTQFPAFDLSTNQYRCILSAKFESVSFDQVKQILSNPSYIFSMSEHIRGTDACNWSLNRQRFLLYHVLFLILVIVSLICSRFFELRRRNIAGAAALM